MKELLDKAREKGAIIYYDVNFRSTHKNEAIKLLPVILENFEYADIIRGSVEDFENMFGLTDADKVYKSKIEFLLSAFYLHARWKRNSPVIQRYKKAL